ncbi:2155_t:CDS:2 [Gigaspora margarita]|uniref:2155_t:CDS:1 n=1 Tax=Gigaspora margarita TaxID=4874 RepID=A0ABN7UPU5_GIGMA|nr:2155_t:CDS:2 [Gigaspora margarita]
MKTGKNFRKLITIILQVFFAVILLIYLIANTVVDVTRSKLTYTTLTFENVDKLPPPAFSLCTDGVQYNFNCTIYGNTSINCPKLIKFVNVTGDNLYNGWFTRCYVFQTTTPFFLAKPVIPPKNWTAFQSAMFIQYSFFNASTISKMQFMIWNPFDLPDNEASATELSSLKTPQILNPYSLTQFDANRERAFTFFWKRHVFLNGTTKWLVDFRSEIGVASNAFGTNNSAIGLIHLKPGSFEIPTTREQPFLQPVSVFTMFIVLAAVLYSTYYALLGGRGKYRNYGLAHMITRYFPQKYIERTNSRDLKPTADDVLKVYLDGINKVEFGD